MHCARVLAAIGPKPFQNLAPTNFAAQYGYAAKQLCRHSGFL
ncbi:transcription initiation factor TFIID subunit 6 [Acetobacter orientalis]|uniref:Transcription initiation factor TFIID subunit 6 n=1 Tax=Acetobacter orientalis TaxID=146474 RepID=A0A2Z5ZKS3_9PROT|nr:transcription initiation factor TFIID subunit 6 [Acetobacter orientalis]